MHPVWNFWTGLYLALALTALGLSVWRRHNEAWVGALILLASWAMTNLIGASQAPQKAFLLYFAFDVVAVEILAFRMFWRTRWWQVVFVAALLGQLVAHLWFWSYEPAPRRYHEILNAISWVQFLCLALLTLLSRPRRPRQWLKPRIVYRRTDPLPAWQPRTVPGQPGACPTIVRAWA